MKQLTVKLNCLYYIEILETIKLCANKTFNVSNT